jgi:hypothetical protein
VGVGLKIDRWVLYSLQYTIARIPIHRDIVVVYGPMGIDSILYASTGYRRIFNRMIVCGIKPFKKNRLPLFFVERMHTGLPGGCVFLLCVNLHIFL